MIGSYVVGQPVRVVYKDNSQAKRGIISLDNEDGTYDVIFTVVGSGIQKSKGIPTKNCLLLRRELYL